MDESVVTLAVYADDLDPADVTGLLDCAPTRSHRRGERRSPTSLPFDKGAWLLTLRGTAPLGPEQLATALLDQLPSDERTWAGLAERFDVQLRFGVHMSGWNKGLDLSAAILRRLAGLGAKLVFDIYADDEASDEGGLTE